MNEYIYTVADAVDILAREGYPRCASTVYNHMRINGRGRRIDCLRLSEDDIRFLLDKAVTPRGVVPRKRGDWIRSQPKPQRRPPMLTAMERHVLDARSQTPRISYQSIGNATGGKSRQYIHQLYKRALKKQQALKEWEEAVQE